MTSANSEFCFFFSNLDFFYFFFCSDCCGQSFQTTIQTVLNSSGESGHPCLVPDFSRNAFNFSPLRIMFAVGLSYMAFIMLRYVPSMPDFWRIFNHKWMLNFVKGLLCIYLDNHMVFIFQFVNVMYHID